VLALPTAGRPRQRAGLALAGAIALVALAPARAAAGALPVGAVLTRVSNLHTVSQWAYPDAEASIRAAPSPRSRGIGRLHFLTGDEQAELYVALFTARLSSGQTWVQIEVPGRPNGRTGWVAQSALESPHTVDGYLRVNRETLRATLFERGRAVFSAPVGVGKASTVTPPGHFYVMEKLVTLDAPVYGPYALGTSAYAPTLNEWPGGGVVGIHGTNEPQLIPGRPSHGCIRMRNGDIRRLWAMIALGTPIEIT
jgi:L,D-transpeptidase catalytic domain